MSLLELSKRCADASLVGQRVVGEINAGCGKCSLCLAGDPRHCPTRTVLGIVGRDGAHAEFLRLPTTEPLSSACESRRRTRSLY